MPYLIKKDKDYLDLINNNSPKTPGELNYLITLLCKNYLKNCSICYGSLNDIIGALECAKQEFYRRVVSPYEDKKIKENGDVY